MFESLLGAIVSATRQNSGRHVMAVVDPGGVKEPPVTSWAVVIVVNGIAVEAKVEQSAAWALAMPSVQKLAKTRPAAMRPALVFLSRSWK